MQITKDCQIVLNALYKEYLDRRSKGVSISEACSFDNAIAIQKNLLPRMSIDDVSGLCLALRDEELVLAESYDNIAQFVTLTPKGIAHMEHQIPEKLKNVGEIIGYLSAAISTYFACRK